MTDVNGKHVNSRLQSFNFEDRDQRLRGLAEAAYMRFKRVPTAKIYAFISALPLEPVRRGQWQQSPIYAGSDTADQPAKKSKAQAKYSYCLYIWTRCVPLIARNLYSSTTDSQTHDNPRPPTPGGASQSGSSVPHTESDSVASSSKFRHFQATRLCKMDNWCSSSVPPATIWEESR